MNKNLSRVKICFKYRVVNFIIALWLLSTVTFTYVLYQSFIKEKRLKMELDVLDTCFPYKPNKSSYVPYEINYYCPESDAPNLATIISNDINLLDESYYHGNIYKCYYNDGKNWEVLYKRTSVNLSFVEVKCTYEGNMIYYDYLPLIPEIKRPIKGRVEMDHIGYDILIIILRGVSRASLEKTMPRTYQTLHELKALEYQNFNSMGVKIVDNLVPLLKGCFYNTYNCWNSPFFWKGFDYFTAYFEDGVKLTSIFTNSRDDTDFDYSWKVNNKIEEMIGNNWINDKYPFCLRNKKYVSVLQEQILKLLIECKLNKMPAFTLFISNAAMENEEVAASMDDEYSDFLSSLYEEKILEDTFLFFTTDFSGYGSTQSNFIERLLPFLFVLVPESFQKKYPHSFLNMRNNQKSIVSYLDLHNTFEDFQSSKQADFKYSKGLFDKLSPFRRCSDVKIPEEYCACERKSVSNQNSYVVAAASSIIYYIQDKFKCDNVKLDHIWDARYIPSAQVFILKLFVSPGHYFLEGVVTRKYGPFEVKSVVKLKSSFSENANNTCFDRMEF